MNHHNVEEIGQSIINTKGLESITPIPGREGDLPEEGQLTKMDVIATVVDIGH